MLENQVEGAFRQIEAGLVDEGLSTLAKLLHDPRMDDELRFETAQFYYQFGFLTEAIEILEKLLQAYQGEPEIILQLAELYMENDDNDKSLELLESITIDQGDDYLRAILLTSELYMMDGLFEVAESKVKKALALFPEEQVLYTALGEIFYHQEKYSLAVLNYEKGSVISTYARLADCYAHLGEFERALDYYKKATLTDKGSAELLFGYGFVAYQLGELELASKKFTELLELDPFYTSAYSLLSEALGQQGKRVEAIHYLDQGIKYDQTNPALFYLKGLLLRQQSEHQESQRWLQQALELDESNTLVLDELLALYMDVEDWDKAQETIDKLLDVVPERSDIYLQKGRLNEHLERWEDAEQAYRQALELNPDSTDVLNQLGYLLRDEGRLNEALEYWQKSILIEPDQDEIAQLLQQE
ncbi:tetratricopeptide repeat protein [Bacillus horti]|uniref:tetratricopeptide repeat protein n=1 Tax=Caldalkalibacillus horti TaxID=77523 RepID=UPI0027D7AA34|nr:tetratricopeptide repeat protein [Bacillus horti]